MAKVLIIDPTRCKGCQSCVIACATRNEGECNINLSRIRVTSFLEEPFFVSTACFQCETPYCIAVCQAKALHKNAETGVVELDKGKCVGCKLCLVACPFGNMTFIKGVAAKCDLCGGDPTCVKVCQWEALTLGEADQIGAGRRAAVANKVRESQQEPAEFPNPAPVKDKREVAPNDKRRLCCEDLKS